MLFYLDKLSVIYIVRAMVLAWTLIMNKLRILEILLRKNRMFVFVLVVFRHFRTSSPIDFRRNGTQETNKLRIQFWNL